MKVMISTNRMLIVFCEKHGETINHIEYTSIEMKNCSVCYVCGSKDDIVVTVVEV